MNKVNGAYHSHNIRFIDTLLKLRIPQISK